MKIYLAGGLFDPGARGRNADLAEELKRLGYQIIIPQEEALKFFDGEKFNTVAIRENCMMLSRDPDSICVACGDGPDADSGTIVELVTAVLTTGRAILWRGDFRTDEEKELGVNAMLKMEGVLYIYYPCFAVTKGDMQIYYQNLALKIHEAIFRVT